jgi:putative ABC transport system permease protein
VLSITFFDRYYESALLRSMGASKMKLREAILIEFGLIGALSGGFGFAGAIILAVLLSKQLSITTYTPNWWFILVGAGLGAFLTMLIGCFSTYKVVNTSPLLLLKEGEA